MKRFLKAGIALLLIGLIVYNSLGYLMVIPMMKLVHRSEASHRIAAADPQSLVQFTIPLAEVKKYRVQGKKELLVDGKMYDIISSQSDGTSVIYSCIHDSKEDKLNQTAASLCKMQQNTLPYSKNTKSIIDHIIKIARVNDRMHIQALLPAYELLNRYSGISQEPYIQVPDHPPCSFC